MSKFFLVFVLISWVFAGCLPEAKERVDERQEFAEVRLDEGKEVVFGQGMDRVVQAVKGIPRTVRLGQPEVVYLKSNRQPLKARVKVAALDVSGPGANARPNGSDRVGERMKPVPVVVPAGLAEQREAGELDNREGSSGRFSFLNARHGLPTSVIRDILVDRDGYLWIGTTGGVCRFDGMNFSIYTREQGLLANDITALYQSRDGDIWLGAYGGTLIRFDGRFFHQYPGKPNIIFCLAEDAAGNIWGGTKDAGAFCFREGEFTYYGKDEGWPDVVYDILVDREDHTWLATNTGVFVDDGDRLVDVGIRGGSSAITIDGGQRIWFAVDGQLYVVDENFIYTYQGDAADNRTTIKDLVFDEAGRLWMATAGSGVRVFNETSIMQYGEDDGLPEQNVERLVKDQHGGIWAACQENVVRYNGAGFTDYSASEGMPYGHVSTLFMDSRERLWMSSVAGSGILCRDGHVLSRYTRQQGWPGNSAMSFAEDHQGRLWAAFWDIGICSFDGNSITTYTTANGLYSDQIFSLAVDAEGNVWCSSDRALIKFEPDRSRFVNYILDGNFCSRALVAGKRGDVWAGSCEGLFRFESARDSSAVLFRHIGRSMEALFIDGGGHLWTAPYEDGVYCFDGRKSIQFTGDVLGIRNTLGAMTEDKAGNLWIGTFASGLLKLDIRKFSDWHAGMDTLPVDSVIAVPVNLGEMITRFGLDDGFLPHTVNHRAATGDPAGNVWFGTSDGITRVNPADVDVGTAPPRVALTAVSLYNQSMDWADPGSNQRKLAAFMTTAGKIRYDSITPFTSLPVHPSLPHLANNITFKFGGVYLRNAKQLRYQYKLDGLDKTWSNASLRSEVNYGNLAPGRYSFMFRSRNTEGDWSEAAAYPFVIRPPWWKAWWARLIYVCLAGGLIFMVRRAELNRQRLTFSLSLEKVEADRLKELDTVKSRLYTNITHEFRTPLTVILGMADQMERRPQDQVRERVRMIRRNGKQLLSLVNQMLDLAKIESHQMSLHCIQGDVTDYMGYVAESFRSLADQKDIRLKVVRPAQGVRMDFDEARILQVISNLLSNAIKFTPPGGEIELRTWVDQGHLRVAVSDTGEGIRPDQLPFIFNTFYQADSSHTRRGEGTGIGLTLTKELVNLMEGDIEVESQLGRGTTFRLRLPIRRSAEVRPISWGPAEERMAIRDVEESEQPGEPASFIGMEGEGPLVLVVEDNPDVMAYLVSCIGEQYRVERAMDGIEGVEKALEIVPDLVITDVMMPGKDGFEVCDTLKKDMRTSHVPVIILTAKATVEDRIAGLARGADAYLAKPFHPDELMVHLGNLIALRKRLQDRYSRLDMSLPAPTTADEQVEDAFLLQLRSLIETNLDNAELSIEDICKRLAMSRMQLHRKIKALTDRSTSLYIRGIRLQHGRRLLEAGLLNVSQTAYAVGFEDPNYFSRVFQEEFGILPSDVRAGQT